MKDEELFTNEIGQAAVDYRHADDYCVTDKYRKMVRLIAETAIEAYKEDLLRDGEVPVVTAYRPEIGVVGRVFDYYRTAIGKSSLYTLTRKRQQKGLARLRECIRKTGGNLTNAETMMKICVDALAASKFHMGDNAQKKQYNDWEEQLFGSEERMERWLEVAQR